MRPATQPRDPPPQAQPRLRAELLDREGQVLRVVELEPAANDEPVTASYFAPVLAAAMRARADGIELELAPVPPADPSGEELEALWRLGRAAGRVGIERVTYRRREGATWMVLTLERKPAT